MKAISLKQPFASLITEGKKTIETRRWPTRYRGDVLIVASKKPKIDNLPIGVAVCVARISNCRPMLKTDERAACCKLYPGAFAWELVDVRPVDPLPVKGMLGFYEVDTAMVQDALDCRNCLGISKGCDVDGLCV